MFEDKKEKYITALKEKGVTKPYQRCGNNGFELLNGYFRKTVQKDINTSNIIDTEGYVATVGVMCTNCGNLNTHLAEHLVKE
ncbi:hypothetical protein [Halobacillus kuroshimensis]|uniref:hypothetical protein n=1 Tax=Halobacillus kuroshimensis TaxID=302481 RepID=UPI00042158D4|nr:hypothetical protein [Halobacillus kuroshimensis]